MLFESKIRAEPNCAKHHSFTAKLCVPLFAESSSVLSQGGQEHDGVAMLMTSNHPRTFLLASGKSRSHVLPRPDVLLTRQPVFG